jgi:hypothetical protein
MSSSNIQNFNTSTASLKIFELIEGLCKVTNADLDRKMISAIMNLISAGVDPESIADMIIELKSSNLAEK